MIELYEFERQSDDSRKDILDFVWGLYISSFPPEERRTRDNFHKTLTSNPFCQLRLIRTENIIRPKGFLIQWNISPHHIFIEHFAIEPEYRNQGIGEACIKAITNTAIQTNSSIWLEVEPPEREIASRRIHFYERAGFKIIDTEYLQPPYEIGGQALPLFLMAFNPQHGEQIQTAPLIHKIVYSHFKEERDK